MITKIDLINSLKTFPDDMPVYFVDRNNDQIIEPDNIRVSERSSRIRVLCNDDNEKL